MMSASCNSLSAAIVLAKVKQIALLSINSSTRKSLPALNTLANFFFLYFLSVIKCILYYKQFYINVL